MTSHPLCLQLLGPSALTAIAVFLSLLPLNFFITKKRKQRQVWHLGEGTHWAGSGEGGLHVTGLSVQVRGDEEGREDLEARAFPATRSSAFRPLPRPSGRLLRHLGHMPTMGQPGRLSFSHAIPQQMRPECCPVPPSLAPRSCPRHPSLLRTTVARISPRVRAGWPPGQL